MSLPINQNLIAIEGTATYERILALARDVDTNEAIQHIHDFLKIYPEFSQAHNDIALLFYRAGNSLKALAHHEKAHKLDPVNITYRKNLANFYFAELEWTGDAIHTYLDILKDNPFDIEALNALGTISLKIGRREQARQYFTRTLQLEGNNMEARQALQELGAFLDAAPSFKSLISESPVLNGKEPVASTSAPVFPSISSVATETVAKETRSPEELYRDAVSLADAGRTDEAILKLEALVEQNSGHALAHNDLGVLYQKRNELQRSLRNHEEAVRLKPSSVVFQKNLADLLCVGFGKFEEALRIYVSLQARAPQDIGILKAIAYICWRVKMPAKARFFLERVLALQPWDREAQETLMQLESDTTLHVKS
jgi:tetratricopeptide (TPR) repeat protein